MEVRRVGDLEFEVDESVAFISRVKFRGGSCYILVPKSFAKSAELKDNDMVGVVLVKIKSIHLAKKEVKRNEE